MESGAGAPLNQSNLLLGVSGTQQAAFSDQRDTDVFMIPLLEGSEVSQLALESRAHGLLDVCSQLLKLNAARVWNPEDQTSAGTEPQIPARLRLSGPDGNRANFMYTHHTAELSSRNTKAFQFERLSVLTLAALFNFGGLIKLWSCIDLHAWSKMLS